MSQHRGYYSLVQFCPDASRLEGVNIGVVLYSPSEKRLQVRITRSNQRIRKFFGNQSWAFVNRAKASILNQLRSLQFLAVEDLQAYISKRANAIQLTPLRSIQVIDLEADARDLYERLVGQDPVERRHRINGFLTEKFMEAGVVDLVRKSVSIEIPDMKHPIRVPYGYQNGRFNLISPVQFDPDQETLLAKIGKSAIEGKVLFERPDPILGGLHLVVVANFSGGIESATREFVRKTFLDHNVALHTFEDLGPLVDDIKRSAAAHSGQVGGGLVLDQPSR